MSIRRLFTAIFKRKSILIFGLALLGVEHSAQSQSPIQASQLPERAVRRTIPITRSIRRAFAAGTRDSTGRPGRNYWQLGVDYAISAKLDPTTSRLSGTERVVIRNNSPEALNQITLRLDPNIFLGTVPRAAPWAPPEITDGMVLSRVVVNGEQIDLTGGGGGRPSTPQPSISGLRSTVARIGLVKPIAPRDSSILEIDWSFKLPGGQGAGHRMTMRWGDTLYRPSQWYPRVTVFDDVRGWDDELYLGPSEFYNNFGRFDVKLDVPGGWIVSGTGLLQNPEQVLTAKARARLAKVLESDATITIVGPDEIGPGQATAPGDRLVWHFVADSVNDFVWQTAKKHNWFATRATIPGRGPIPINIIYPLGKEKAFENAGPIVRHALQFYSQLWFPYPFPQLTIEDGSGMEYPMVINTSAWAADHEAAHQWWPMVVSNNETWYGWMDEGFNEFMNVLSDADAAGNPPNWDGRGQSYGFMSGSESEPPMMWNANYGGPSDYFFTTYSKAPLMLSMLGGVVGDSAVIRAHREWAVAWKFKHPTPWDYMFFMNNALGRDLGWFWYYWLFTTESVDGSIQDVKTSGSTTTVTVHQAGEMPSPVVIRVRFAATGPALKAMPNAVMEDDRTALVTWPVDVWFAGSRTFKAVLDFGGRAIEHLTLDPHGRFPDSDPKDNVWPK